MRVGKETPMQESKDDKKRNIQTGHLVCLGFYF